MDKLPIIAGIGFIVGFYCCRKLFNFKKPDRPTLETINDYHLYQTQHDYINKGNLFNVTNNSNNNVYNNNQNLINNTNFEGKENFYYNLANTEGNFSNNVLNSELKDIAIKENYVSPYSHLIKEEPFKK